MKAGEVGESLLISALNACRARLKAFIRGRTAVRDDVDDILQEVTAVDESGTTGRERRRLAVSRRTK